MGKNPFIALREEAPQVAGAFDGLIQALSSTDGLDAAMRQLIYIGIKASQGETAAVVAHIPMAKAQGVTRAQIRDAILLTQTVCGVTGVTHCLVPALEAYDGSVERV